jgi:hypothetical protein
MTNTVIPGHKPLIGRVCHGISRGFAPICGAGAAKEAMMRPFKTLTKTLTVASLAIATPALALTPINEEPYINDVLLQGFIGDAIDDNCPTIEARKLRALNELTKLRDYALKQGYSAKEIREFVTSDTEKARGKAQAAEILKERGAEPGMTEVYCAIGEEEIAKDSLIGQLLRSTK